MSLKTPLKKIIHLWNTRPKLDNKGALLIPTSFKKKDFEFMQYRHLPVNWEIKSVSKDDLPIDFSKRAVKIVDLFRRKTFDLDFEIMIIFDYKTGELIYCFVNEDGDGDEVSGQIDLDVLSDKDVAIIHNHPFEYGSAPSCENFQILGMDFQDYEILSSWDGIWVIESKELIPSNELSVIKEKILQLFEYSCEIAEKMYDDEEKIISKSDELYSNLLLEFINNFPLNIRLSKKEL